MYRRSVNPMSECPSRCDTASMCSSLPVAIGAVSPRSDRAPVLVCLDPVLRRRRRMGESAPSDEMSGPGRNAVTSMSIILAADVAGSADHVFKIRSSTEDQKGFGPLTATSRLTRLGSDSRGTRGPDHRRHDEAGRVGADAGAIGFPVLGRSTWEWELGPATRAASRAMILDRLAMLVGNGESQPFFPAATDTDT